MLLCFPPVALVVTYMHTYICSFSCPMLCLCVPLVCAEYYGKVLLCVRQIDEDMTAKLDLCHARFSFMENELVFTPNWMAPEGAVFAVHRHNGKWHSYALQYAWPELNLD